MLGGMKQFIVVRIAQVATGCLALAIGAHSSRFVSNHLSSTTVQDRAAASASLVSICKIQGSAFTSPHVDENLRTQGVVYADLDESSKRGFFLQAENCDDNPSTSDGIFVYLGARSDVVTSGDKVEVTGIAQEYYGRTEINATSGSVTLISTGNPLPAPVDLAPPFDNSEASWYFESLEGMYVKLDDAAVVGPTSVSDETWVVRADLGIARVFRDDPSGSGEIICVDDGGLFEIVPEAKVGDRVTGLAGALDYSMGVYRVQLIAAPNLIPASSTIKTRQATLQQPSGFSVATFNLANLFDTFDDPETEDSVLSAAEYQRRLKKRALAIHNDLAEPAIIAVQEAENLSVLQALAARPEIEAEYGIVWVDGPDRRGIDVALFYRTDRIVIVDYQSRQGCTSLIDGLGPDGNRDMTNPQNSITCDTDGDGVLDGNRLFSRPPLVVHLRVCQDGCQTGTAANEGQMELRVIIGHLKSKIEDVNTIQYTAARRIEQAQFLARLIQEILSAVPADNLILLGDLNDYPDSVPLSILTSLGLRDLVQWVDKSERYTFIYRGVSQVLDYVLDNLSLSLVPVGVTPVHVNADYPAAFDGVAGTSYRSSDHDPLVVHFIWLDHFSYLPQVATGH